MKRKIHPKDQTRELSRAIWEFSQRNNDAREELRRIIDTGNELFTEENFKAYLQRPAATAYYGWLEYFREHPFSYESDDKTNEDMTIMYERDARRIFMELIGGEPLHVLLMGIDMRRSKAAILAEVEELVDLYKKFHQGDEKPGREKWLPIVDEILAVWDAASSYERVRDFRAVAKKLNMKYSTVQKRWNLAYKLIYGKDYDPADSKEDMKGRAFELCANCPPEKYNQCHVVVDGLMEWHPCEEFKKLYGSDYLREKIFENIDDVMDAVAYEEWNNDEEPLDYTEE